MAKTDCSRTSMIRTVIAGKNNRSNHDVRAMIEAAPGFEVIGETFAGGGIAAVCIDKNPDVIFILTDVSFMEISDLAKKLRKNRAKTKIIVFGPSMTVENIVRLIRAGVSGIVSTSVSGVELMVVARRILNGLKHVPPEIADDVMHRMFKSPSNGIEILTNREFQVLTALAGAKSVREISSELDISPRTVESHKNRIMKKMELKNMAELVHTAIREGIVSTN